MPKEKVKKSLERFSIINYIRDMGWFSRLCIVGGVLMVIDSLFELITSSMGIIVLIFSCTVILFSTQIQDETPKAYVYIIVVLILTYFNNIYFHLLRGIEWTIGLGYIGTIIINICATFALLLIIISVAAFDNREPIRSLWLFLIGYILLGIHLFIYLFFSLDISLSFPLMLAIFYFSLISICGILMVLDQKLIGALIIWLISIISFISGLIGGSLNTPVTGFGVGMTIVGNIALLYFINELGLQLVNPKTKKV